MIRSWKNAKTRKVYEDGSTRGFRGLDSDAAIEVLKMLNAASRLNQLSPLKSVGLHRLKGDKKGHWAMTINGPWRVVFRFQDGDAHNVEIIDYHRG